MKKKHLSKGLTLTELLIVIGIIVFLALIAMILLRSQLFKGKDAKRKADIHKIQIAVEEYEKDHDCYPLPQLVTCDPGDGLADYLDKIPCDPQTNASYFYDYENSSCPSWYRVYADLENAQDADAYAACGPGGAYNYYASSPNAPNCNLVQGSYYGCKSGSCVPILWNVERPGPECDPNFQSPTCYGQCGIPSTECKSWTQ